MSQLPATRFGAASCLILVVMSAATPALAGRVDELTVPPGFEVAELITDLDGPRQMALGSAGTLFIGSLRNGNVVAIRDALTAPKPPIVIARGLTMPNGVEIHDGTLYVGALTQILAYPDIERRLAADLEPVVVTSALPDKRHHGWRYLRFGPDGYLYVSIGAPCNVCVNDDERLGSIVRMDPATGSTTVYAHGVRNSVGMAFHPETGEMWFSDNGRDRMGDDVPAEEINRVPGDAKEAPHYGFPFVHQDDLPDPRFGGKGTRTDYTAPVALLPAHSAALGIAFYRGDAFPARYRSGLFVAQHGSWNRSTKSGYVVSFLHDNGKELVAEPFVTGWLQGQKNWGRPVDVLVTPDDRLLISDDQGGVIYAVSATGAATADTNEVTP